MSFETDLKKMQKLWDNSQGNSFSVEITRNKLDIKGVETTNLIPRTLNFNNLFDLGGNYQDSTLLVDQIDGTEGTIGIIGILWTITVKNIPEDFIPFMRINIGYNSVGTVDPTGSIMQFCSVDSFVPSSDNADIGTAMWSVCFTYQLNQSDPTLTPDTGLKLYMVLLNPTLIV